VPSPRRRADWLEIAVEVAGIDSELVVEILRQGCPGGVVIEPAVQADATGEGHIVDGDAPALVKGYLPPDRDSARVRRSLRLALGLAPLQQPPRWHRSRYLPAQVWQDSWKRYFRPRRVGRSLLVKPSWASCALRASDIVIEIDPGMAFGTGQHPTTAMCLRTLEETVQPGMGILDLGTGSGILAIAAAKLGAASVLALDIDPLATKAARQNAAANRVEALVDVRQGGLSEAEAATDSFDLIVVNISSLTTEQLAPAFGRSLRAGGVLIASGFLEDAVEDLCRIFRHAGLTVARVLEDGVWRAIVARKSPT